MTAMRTLLPVIALFAAAGPAMAQPTTPAQLEDLRARLEASERQSVARSNELMALEARQRADQAVYDLQAQRQLPPTVPALRYEPGAPVTPASVLARYPSMPDAALADSNKRVQAAATNRH